MNPPKFVYRNIVRERAIPIKKSTHIDEIIYIHLRVRGLFLTRGYADAA